MINQTLVRYKYKDWILAFSLTILYFFTVKFWGLNGVFFLFVIPLLFGSLLLFKSSFALPVLYVFGTFLILENPPGINPAEVVYFSIITLVLLQFAGQTLRGDLQIADSSDRLLLLLIFTLGWGIFVGILLGSDTVQILAETSVFFPLFGYFLIKRNLNQTKFLRVFLIAVSIVILAVHFRNFLNYTQIIIQATMAWEIELARVAVNEIIVLISTVTILVFGIYENRGRYILIYFLVFSIFFASLVLTQSRGFWITFLICSGILFLASTSVIRKRILRYFTILIIVITGFLVTFGQDYLELVSSGLFERVSTLTSLNEDVSLQERYRETHSVWTSIISNPIIGNGIGNTYTRSNIILNNTYGDQSYIHNGYLSIWFKFGIVGLLAYLISICYLVFISWQVFKSHPDPLKSRLALGVFCTFAGSFPLLASSPFISMLDGLFVFVCSIALISSFYNELPVYGESSISD